MQNQIGAPKQKLSFSDPKVRAWLFQIITIVAVVSLGWYLFHNTQTNLQHRGITSGFDFLARSAGFGIAQPDENAESVVPDVLFVPLVGFTAQGDRLGQGGGHYDRWLAEHPNTVAIGLAWDCQLVEDLPSEPHDVPLSAVVTPTRTYGPFA